MERAVRDLQAEVGRNPDTYVGAWSGEIRDRAGQEVDRAMVVGTVAEIESVAAELRSRFPYNLCIVRAEHSASDLQRAARALSAMDRPWELQLDPRIARVVVRVAAFGQPAAEAISPYASLVSVRPIVVRADD